MTKFIKVIATVVVAAIAHTLFAYNGGYENSSLTDITIGGVTYKGYGNNTVTKRAESGTTIAANKYAQCKKLKTVDLTGVTSIGDAAFAYSALESVAIPATVKSMGYIAFGGCTNLTSATFSPKTWNWYDASKEPFRDCSNLAEVAVASDAPDGWDFNVAFPSVKTVKCPKAYAANWAKKFAGEVVPQGGDDPVVRCAVDDLNGDDRADIVMTIYEKGHGAEGATGAWLIKADQTAAWGDLSQRNPGWDILGTGVTKAGKATKDVYVISWENVVGAWVTDSSGKVTGWETVGSFDGETMVGGLGDFNGDGQSDLLLVNRNGAIGCYFTSGAKTGWNYFQSLGSEWQICGIGDLNGDGRDDLVLKHDAGFAGSWLTQADGTMAWADLDTLPAGFAIVGCGDFDGDGTDDVLLKSGNYYGAWIVRNGNASAWMGIGDLGSVTVEQIADFDADGRDDLRIRTAAGDLGAELVKGEDSLKWAYYGSVGAEWSTEPIGLK